MSTRSTDNMYTQVLFVINILIVLVQLPQYSTACNGYDLKVLYFKDCNDNNVMKITDAGATLDADCNFIPKGCLKTDGFESAMIHYKIEKKPLPPLEGDIDLCEAMTKQSEHSDLIAGFKNLPSKCAKEKFERCLDGTEKLDISKFKSKLGLGVGIAVVNITIKHDVGETCWTLSSEIKKEKKG